MVNENNHLNNLLHIELPHPNVIDIMCSDNLFHPNSQACDGRSSSSRDLVDSGIFGEPNSFLFFDENICIFRGIHWPVITDDAT